MEKVDADTVLSAVLSSRTFHSNNLIKWQTKGTKGEEIYIFSEMVDFKSFMFFSLGLLTTKNKLLHTKCQTNFTDIWCLVLGKSLQQIQ